MERRPEKTVTSRDSDNEDRLDLSQSLRQTRETTPLGKFLRFSVIGVTCRAVPDLWW